MIKNKAKDSLQRLFRFGLESIKQDLDRQQHQLDDIKRRLDAADFRIDELKSKVKHVEHYQPVYGINGIVDTPARQSADRCAAILDALDDVAGMRILDIGSSLGYVSFYMADRGAVVDGWDNNAENVEVSRLIGQITGIPARFETKELNNDTIATISTNNFDVVIVLNVFHHIIRFQGLEATKKLVKAMLEKSPTMIVELAKKGEDPKLPWDKFQPEDELAIFKGLDVTVTKLGMFGNHLSDKKRPLYKIETEKAVTVNGTKYVYDYATHSAYSKSPLRRDDQLLRKYYFSDEVIIKEYGLKTPLEKHFHIGEVHQEVASLYALAKLKDRGKVTADFPEVYDYEIRKDKSWIVLKRVGGKLLTDLKVQKSVEQKQRVLVRVLQGVLHQLADMHAQKLYHNDVRAWNIIVNEKRAQLIDFGQCSHIALGSDLKDLVWAIYDFMVETREVGDGNGELPPEKVFKDYPIGYAFYHMVKKGETDAGVIAENLQLGKKNGK